MKSSKKTMLVIAVTLLLAAALFIGAGAAADSANPVESGTSTQAASGNAGGDQVTEITYWHNEGATGAEANTDYTLVEVDGEVTGVKIHTERGLGWLAKELMNTDSGKFKDSSALNIVLDNGNNYNMSAHKWLPLSTKKVEYSNSQGLASPYDTAKMTGAVIKALNGATFTGATAENPNHIATIEGLHIINTLEFDPSQDANLGHNNNYGSGFIGIVTSDASTGLTFENLKFLDETIAPENTYNLVDTSDKNGYNQIGGIVGLTDAPVTFRNVTMENCSINGSSKVGAFIGHAGKVQITFENCAASGTVTGLDSVGELIGLVRGNGVPVPVVDNPTKWYSNVTINWGIWPAGEEFTVNNIDKEMLAVVDVNGKVWELWTDNTQTAISTSLPDADKVIGVIKGTLGVDSEGKTTALTNPKIRVTDAGLFNYDQSQRDKTTMPLTTQVKIYGMTTAVPVNVESTPVAKYVARIVNSEGVESYYYTITDALNAVQDNQTIILNDGLMLFPGAALDINLNDRKFTLDLSNFFLYGRLNIKSAQMTIDNGTIISNYIDNSQHPGENLTAQALNVYGANAGSGYGGELTIGPGLTVRADINPVVMFGNTAASETGYNAAIIVNGTVKATISAEKAATAAHTEGAVFVSGNLRDNETAMIASNTITFADGCVVDGGALPAVVLNGSAETTVNGGIITGNDGISVKRGTLNVPAESTAVIKATGQKPAKDEVKQDGSGAEMSGSAITISSTYSNSNEAPISVTLSGGNFVSENNHAVYVAHSKGASGDKAFGTKPTVSLEGGKYTGANGEDAVAVQAGIEGDASGYTQEIVPSTSTGSFSKLDSKYIKQSGGSIYTVNSTSANGGSITEIKVNGVLKTLATGNDTVTFKAKPDDGYKVSSVSVEGQDEQPTKDGDKYTFKMGHGDVTITATFSKKSSSSSSSSQGSSVWLTNDTPVETKVTPTPTPTPGAAETPGVKPVNPSDAPAKTPAPFLGILAGLGAAAVVFGLRRK